LIYPFLIIIGQYHGISDDRFYPANNYFMGNIMSDFKKYHCLECEHIYDEEKGDPDSGIPPGTRWADIPDDWDCPICGAPKSFFKLMK
jgi:rubredoxin